MTTCALHVDRTGIGICTRCERPFCGECARTLRDRPYCRACVEELERKLAARQSSPPAPPPLAISTTARVEPEAHAAFLRPIAYAAVAGIVGALLWFGSVVLTDYKTGLVAIGVGWLVGVAALRGAGGRPSPGLGAASVFVALGAMLFGEYLIVNHVALAEFARESPGTELPAFIPAGLFFPIYGEATGPMDLVFYAIGAWEAWKIPTRGGEGA